MSDIPDWLVELAAQGSDDQEAEERDDDTFDFAAIEPQLRMPEPGPAETVSEISPAPVAWELNRPAPVVDEPETDTDLMNALRSQVEADQLEDALQPVKSKRSISLQLPGLLPWQQFVLVLLFLLDVVVIGLLFLVMLGRVAIG